MYLSGCHNGLGNVILDDVSSVYMDPVTFQPAQPGDVAPVVNLALEYDSEPASGPFGRVAWGVPLWLALLVGGYAVTNWAGGRI